MIRPIKDIANVVDLILNGAGKQIPFTIYYQEFNKTVDTLAVAIEFSGLISSDDFKDGIEIATYPRINGKISSSGIYRTEGQSCTLKVIRQYDSNIDESQRAELDNNLKSQLNMIQFDSRNIFIPAKQPYNLPYDLINYRITELNAVDRDKINTTTYSLKLEQVPVTDWASSYMQIMFSRPEYANEKDQGQAKTRTL